MTQIFNNRNHPRNFKVLIGGEVQRRVIEVETADENRELIFQQEVDALVTFAVPGGPFYGPPEPDAFQVNSVWCVKRPARVRFLKSTKAKEPDYQEKCHARAGLHNKRRD